MAAVLMVEADAPTFDHGETEDKPIPVPNASRILEPLTNRWAAVMPSSVIPAQKALSTSSLAPVL